MENLLKFLALDNALINCDGYWIRASDYCIYLDPAGKFHFVPHDMNEAFRPAMGPGFGGGPGGPGGRGPGGRGFGPNGPNGPEGFGPPPGGFPFGPDGLPRFDDGNGPPPRGENPRGPRDERRPPIERPAAEGAPAPQPGQPSQGQGPFQPRQPGGFGPGPGGPGGRTANVELDPLIGLDEARKPLRSKILAVPSLRAKYLAYVKQIAQDSLDWAKLGPGVAQYRSLVEKEIEADTRKLSTFAAFQQATADRPAANAEGRGRPHMPLRTFADQRRAYLLKYEARP
jgi:hypothetical protein